MRKVAIMLMAAGTLTLGGMAAATPPAGGPPGQGDCSHGNSGQTCVPDPQPTHGQDCEEHGNAGGVNEDHCLPQETTTVPPVTTTTVTGTTTTTTITTTTPETTSPGTTTTTTTIPTTTTAVETTTTSAPPTEGTSTSTTSSETTTTPPGTSPPSQTSSPGGKSPSQEGPEKPQDGGLAFTGVEDVVPIVGASLALLTAGMGLLWAGRKKEKNNG